MTCRVKPKKLRKHDKLKSKKWLRKTGSERRPRFNRYLKDQMKKKANE